MNNKESVKNKSIKKINTGLIIFLLLMIIFITISGCYYDSEEYLFPEYNQVCDTSNITYSVSVSTILDQYCLQCHNSSDAAFIGGNIILETYNQLKTKVDDGSFIGAITHQSGFSQMPKGSDKLNNCKLTILQKWVDNGSTNN